MNPGNLSNNNQLTPEQFQFLQQLQQKQQQQQQQLSFQPLQGQQQSIPFQSQQQQSQGQGQQQQIDWRKNVSDQNRQEMVNKLYNAVIESKAGSGHPPETIRSYVMNTEKEQCWEKASSVEEYTNLVSSRLLFIKQQAQKQQMLQQQQQLLQQLQNNPTNQKGNTSTMGNLGMQGVQQTMINSIIRPPQQGQSFQQQQQQQQIPQFRPVGSNLTFQQQQQQNLANLHNQIQQLLKGYASLKNSLAPDPVVERKISEHMNKMKKKPRESLSLSDGDKKFIKDFNVQIESAIYVLYTMNPNDPKFEAAIQLKWFFIDQVAALEKDVYYLSKDICIKLLTDLKVMLATCIRQNQIVSATGTVKTPSVKDSSSVVGTPDKTTPPSMAAAYPLQPPIKKEDVQAILIRDFALSADLTYSEIVALEEAFFPTAFSNDSSLIDELVSAENICEMDTKFLFGDCKLVDPNQGNISNSRTFHNRWEKALSRKDQETSGPAFEEEVRSSAYAHQLSHNIQFLNDDVSVLFYGKNNSVLGLFVADLSKYQQAQIGNPGKPPYMTVELVDGFSADVCEVLSTMIKQGMSIKNLLEFLWPVL